MRLASRDRRLGDVFRNKSVVGSIQHALQNLNTEWYRMHQPLLYHTLRELATGKLKPTR